MDDSNSDSYFDGQLAMPSKWWSNFEDLTTPFWLGLPARVRRPVRLLRLSAQAVLKGIPVAWYRGQSHTSGRTGRLLVVGEEPWVKYIPYRLFCIGASNRAGRPCALVRTAKATASFTDDGGPHHRSR
jgi:hypothetical protein